MVRASETPHIREEPAVEQDDSDPVCRQEMANDYLQWSPGMACGPREQAGDGAPISAWGAHVSPWVTLQPHNCLGKSQQTQSSGSPGGTDDLEVPPNRDTPGDLWEDPLGGVDPVSLVQASGLSWC